MYKPTFGTKNQITFTNAQEYYQLLGFLAKNDGSTEIHWEPNDLSGAWGPEGRLHFYVNPPTTLKANLHLTAGNTSILHRVNCNEFVENIINNHNFIEGSTTQNLVSIRATIPHKYIADFEDGLSL
jgi:hypothetical protein